MIGLEGVVLDNVLVVVGQLNDLIRRCKDENMLALIAEGAADRLHPAILTTVTIVIGLVPLTYSFGGEDAMMEPMAMALGYGLLFAMPITLILLQGKYSCFSSMPVVL